MSTVIPAPAHAGAQCERGGRSVDRLDYSILDRPEILGVVFYPRQDWTATPPNAHDYMVPVEPGVSVSCRYYPASAGSPCILYFHGNGEVASDYDGVAPLYNGIDVGLFVADFRGYGRSSGTPGFASMAADADAVLSFFQEAVQPPASSRRLFVMGRSLGTHSATELASQHPEDLDGLIVESGAPIAARLAGRLGSSAKGADELVRAVFAQIRSIELPALVMHGERDSLIPVDAGIELHRELGSKEKRLVIIPGAGHNDIMMVGAEQYLRAIKDFVFQDRD